MKLIIIGAIVLILVILYYGLRNSLVAKKNQVENAFATIDVLLKKRCDLIPNLIASVQQYMQFEQKTLTDIAQLRSQAVSGQVTASQRVQLENQISRALGNIMVAVEAYPDLKASGNFQQLQAALNEVEEQISAARRFYNSAVTDYNNAIEMVPTNIVASSINYQAKPLFEASEHERRNVDVRNLFGGSS